MTPFGHLLHYKVMNKFLLIIP